MVLNLVNISLKIYLKFSLYFQFLQLSTIWAETADNARSAARTYVLGGLSEKNYGLSNFWVADRLNVIQSLYTITISEFGFGVCC